MGVLLRGPAPAIAMERFNLTVEPRQFEYLAQNQDASLDIVDSHFTSAQQQLTAAGGALLTDIDAAAPAIATMLSLADEIGEIAESGALDDLSAIGYTIDPDLISVPFI